MRGHLSVRVAQAKIVQRSYLDPKKKKKVKHLLELRLLRRMHTVGKLCRLSQNVVNLSIVENRVPLHVVCIKILGAFFVAR